MIFSLIRKGFQIGHRLENLCYLFSLSMGSLRPPRRHPVGVVVKKGFGFVTLRQAQGDNICVHLCLSVVALAFQENLRHHIITPEAS